MKESDPKSRRRFFKLTGISILGLGLMSFSPFELFNKPKPKKLKKVKINFFAVKRK